MEGMASDNSVIQILDLKNLTNSDKSGINQVPIEISVQGNFNNVMKYLHDL